MKNSTAFNILLIFLHLNFLLLICRVARSFIREHIILFFAYACLVVCSVHLWLEKSLEYFAQFGFFVIAMGLFASLLVDSLPVAVDLISKRRKVANRIIIISILLGISTHPYLTNSNYLLLPYIFLWGYLITKRKSLQWPHQHWMIFSTWAIASIICYKFNESLAYALFLIALIFLWRFAQVVLVSSLVEKKLESK